MMLCGLFKTHRRLPSSMGEVLKFWIEEVYWPIKLEGHVFAAERPNWDEIVGRLAWEMNLEGKTFLPFEKSKQVLESSLAELSKSRAPADVQSYLNQLLDFHLIRPGKRKSIEFPHQLIQELHAATRLCSLLERAAISDDDLKQNYLNAFEWTETLAITLSLLEYPEHVIRVLTTAFDVDLVLGARLAGKAAPQFQKTTVSLINQLGVPLKNKIFLLGESKSVEAIQHIIAWLSHEEESVRYQVAETLAKIGSDKAADHLITLLRDEDTSVLWRAACALGAIGTDKAVDHLISVLNYNNSPVSPIAGYAPRCCATSMTRLSGVASMAGLLRVSAV